MSDQQCRGYEDEHVAQHVEQEAAQPVVLHRRQHLFPATFANHCILSSAHHQRLSSTVEAGVCERPARHSISIDSPSGWNVAKSISKVAR